MGIVSWNTKIKFLALARDCANSLPVLFALMRDLEAKGYLVSAVIGENGSKDGTRTVLLKAALNIQLEVIDTEFMATIPNRLERMARGREALKNRASDQDADYICVVDVDTVLNKHLNVNLFIALIEELSEAKTVFGVCAASYPVFYDILSLRMEHGVLNDADILNQFVSNRDKRKPLRNYVRKILLMESCYRRQEEIGTGSGKTFLSAFNGLCVYRAKDYFAGSYIGDFQLCEHVTLNENLAKNCGSGILVSRFFHLDAPVEHTRKSKFKTVFGSLKRLATTIFRKKIQKQ